MKPLTLALLLLSVSAMAQIPIRQDIQGYRGNIVQSDTIRVSPADTVAGLTVRAQGNSAPASSNLTPQPTIVRKGLGVVIRFATSLTLPDLGYYRLMAGGQTIVYGDVRVSTQGITTPGVTNTVLLSLTSRLGVLESGKLNTTTFTAFQSMYSSNRSADLALIAAKEPAIASGSSTQYIRGDKTLATLNAAAVGLGSVNNTSDANKPVSTAQQAALDLKANQATTYTKTEVDAKFLGKSAAYSVTTVEAANALATGTEPRLIYLTDPGGTQILSGYLYYPGLPLTEFLTL